MFRLVANHKSNASASGWGGEGWGRTSVLDALLKLEKKRKKIGISHAENVPFENLVSKSGKRQLPPKKSAVGLSLSDKN